ncbi:MAG: hypothetical protein IMF01_09625 [Proteobacteria bacterium]|nr:hypothetical protein [Pseudomonadota bacterium]
MRLIYDLVSQITAPGISRESYGFNIFTQPNNHCFWCPYEQAWIEKDDHLRDRYRKYLGEMLVDDQ